MTSVILDFETVIINRAILLMGMRYVYAHAVRVRARTRVNVKNYTQKIVRENSKKLTIFSEK